MKKLFLILLGAVAGLGAAGQLDAYIPPKPPYGRMLNDENVFAYYHSAWRKIEDKLIDHTRRTGKQLVWITIPTTGGNSIDQLAVAIFRTWGIGNKEKNTGLLVLVARKEKQIRIETGYGLEGEVPDIVAGKIIREIIQPSFDSSNYILPPQHPSLGYIPAMERALDTLIRLTVKPDTAALQSATAGTSGKKQQRWLRIIIIVLGIMAAWALLKRGWWWFNHKMEQPPAEATGTNSGKRKQKSASTSMGQYIVPVIILILVLCLTLLLHWNWILFTGVSAFLFLRWIYYLPSPKLSAETIRFNKEWEAKRGELKKEYMQKKKILGSDKQYASFDEYWAKYLELGLDKIEKELGEGHYAARPAEKKKKYGVGALLYDVFLGNSASEKKRSPSGTAGYSGESTGGQQAGGFGGGSSGGGGASS